VVGQVFQVTLFPHSLSAWHCHEVTTDRLFVNQGLMKVVLYDARQDSPSYGQVNEFRLGSMRPGLLIVPPKVWHGVQNISDQSGMVINIVDRAYEYDDPDHWRLPYDSPEIPYDFTPKPSIALQDALL
jgi:dTDP-4-dehydrorhamnose 3,5-epimerase